MAAGGASAGTSAVVKGDAGGNARGDGASVTGAVPLRDDGCVEPNLARIPADKDADAEAILELARGGVTADLLDCMNDRDAVALGWYGARHTTGRASPRICSAASRRAPGDGDLPSHP